MSLQVLITGASRGLGLELVRQYATRGEASVIFAACREGANAPGLRAFLQELQAQQQQGPTTTPVVVHPVSLDVTSPASVAALSDTLKTHDARINVLWNNAGVALGRQCNVGDNTMDYDEFSSSLGTNVMGPVRVLEACVPHLDVDGADGFTVVNMSSGLGSISRVMGGGFNTLSQDIVYRSSKAALNMCTVCAAAELKAKFPGKKAVVVAMDPGWVNTDMGSRGGTVKPPLEPGTSVSGMREVVSRLTAEDTGKFFSHGGEEMPW